MYHRLILHISGALKNKDKLVKNRECEGYLNFYI